MKNYKYSWKQYFILIFIGILLTFFISSCSETTITLPQQKTEEIITPKSVKIDKENIQNREIKVHYLDVGQADSIIIQLPDNQNILIDAGNNEDSNFVLNYLKKNGIKKIDFVIGTHPHEDHIGGLDVVIRNFDIGKVYLPKISHNTKTFEDLLLPIKEKELKIIEAKAGILLNLNNEIEGLFIAPNSNNYDELNNYSAVFKLTYNDTSFLFTGDAEQLSEEEILNAGPDLRADVLKVGHHGSNTSTSANFLKAVSPKYAVISVGKDNKYHHPHSATLTRLEKSGVRVLRTDIQGTIIAQSNGIEINFNVSRDYKNNNL